jgi:cytochrome c2
MDKHAAQRPIGVEEAIAQGQRMLAACEARHAALLAKAREWGEALDAYTVRPWGKAEQARYADARAALRAALEGEA